MAGPVITIALPEALFAQVLGALDMFLRGLADSNFEHPKSGYWALNVEPERLGITVGVREGSRPLLVEESGPGNKDGQFFEDGRFIEADRGLKTCSPVPNFNSSWQRKCRTNCGSARCECTFHNAGHRWCSPSASMFAESQATSSL